MNELIGKRVQILALEGISGDDWGGQEGIVDRIFEDDENAIVVKVDEQFIYQDPESTFRTDEGERIVYADQVIVLS